MKFRVITFALLVVAACATTERYVSSRNPWIGKPVASMIDKLGQPSKVIELPSGEKQYLYETTSQSYEMAYGGYGKDTLNPQTSTCRTTWLVSKEGMVERAETSGNHCEPM